MRTEGTRYMRAVSAYASQLRANQRAFLGYYHWQVFYGDTLLPEGYPARPPTPAQGCAGCVRDDPWWSMSTPGSTV